MRGRAECIQIVLKLPDYKLPKHYGWEDRTGKPLKRAVSLADVGFKWISDGLNKDWGEFVLPQDFDKKLFIFGKRRQRSHRLMKPNINSLVLAQRFLDREHLIRCIECQNVDPVHAYQCGRYLVVRDGHHRLARGLLRGESVFFEIRELVREQ